MHPRDGLGARIALDLLASFALSQECVYGAVQITCGARRFGELPEQSLFPFELAVGPRAGHATPGMTEGSAGIADCELEVDQMLPEHRHQAP